MPSAKKRKDQRKKYYQENRARILSAKKKDYAEASSRAYSKISYAKNHRAKSKF